MHLLEYRTEDEFWRHYSERYQTLFDRAELFIESTGGASNTDNVMVFMRFVPALCSSDRACPRRLIRHP